MKYSNLPLNFFSDNTSSNLKNINILDQCLQCKKEAVPELISCYTCDSLSSTSINVGILLFCPHCGHFYVREYSATKISDYSRDYTCSKEITKPYDIIVNIHIPENINNISKEFIELYKQSAKAEEIGLDKICGPGYRKSLEFLIKDYAIHINPDKENEIKKASLGQVIENYYGSMPQLQSLSKMATYIGNDETHYIRKWNDQDIKSMKKFIMSAVNLISGTLYAEKAAKLIDENKK